MTNLVNPLPTRSGILSAVGNTPLISLSRVFKSHPFRLVAKLEYLNPGGSIKDRSALQIIESAIQDGIINSDTIVVESTSGNMGIGLAQTCKYYGLKLICVVDPNVTRQNIDIMRVYGANIEIATEADPDTGTYLYARLRRVEQLCATIENCFWPNQYKNENNAVAHQTTMHEIIATCEEPIDYLFCATSTCGTIRGCSDYLRTSGHSTVIVAVDAVASRIFECQPGNRELPGLGASVKPGLFKPEIADRVVYVTDRDCVVGCRHMLTAEAMLVGGSSGGIMAAIHRLRSEIRENALCVAILPDRGERYMDTIYNDEWVRSRHGNDRLEFN